MFSKSRRPHAPLLLSLCFLGGLMGCHASQSKDQKNSEIDDNKSFTSPLWLGWTDNSGQDWHRIAPSLCTSGSCPWPKAESQKITWAILCDLTWRRDLRLLLDVEQTEGMSFEGCRQGSAYEQKEKSRKAVRMKEGQGDTCNVLSPSSLAYELSKPGDNCQAGDRSVAWDARSPSDLVGLVWTKSEDRRESLRPQHILVVRSPEKSAWPEIDWSQAVPSKRLVFHVDPASDFHQPSFYSYFQSSDGQSTPIDWQEGIDFPAATSFLPSQNLVSKESISVTFQDLNGEKNAYRSIEYSGSSDEDGEFRMQIPLFQEKAWLENAEGKSRVVWENSEPLFETSTLSDLVLTFTAQGGASQRGLRIEKKHVEFTGSLTLPSLDTLPTEDWPDGESALLDLEGYSRFNLEFSSGASEPTARKNLQRTYISSNRTFPTR